jgi:hypothetical protein
LNTIENTYSVFKNGVKVGEITFIKYAQSPLEWLIKSVEGSHPVSLIDYSASTAKAVLEKRGYTWVAGKNKPFYLYC